ncbi:MAG: DCC1-like thiol-disulfide oxidoreductase family protein [Pseudomonadota bacterium]
MKATLIYDGQCPLCSRYVQLTRLREHVELQIVDAREQSPEVIAAREEGFELDKGMVLRLDDATYHGSAAISALAMLTTPNSVFNRINATVFRSPTFAKLVYPILVFGRNSLLWLLGRQKLGY